ncbi:hypothetical protein [Pseudescherichia sp.]|jgi:hypothetical protein|uniref:hypothetical protein n=1 Tax=Pseudescherichia sp. TaxID=2055881 RepID=UPI0028977CF3|nr:hypothetical protein [Pseudescherichia sp.]
MSNKVNDDTTPLEAPTVLNASDTDNYTIDQYDIKAGLVLEIPKYANPLVDDVVLVHWADYQEQYSVINPDEDLPIMIDVFNDYPPVYHGDGTYDVWYEVTDTHNNNKQSEHLTLIIDAGERVATLPAPTSIDAAPGYINLEAASDGVQVDIAYSSMATGDAITLTMQGYDETSDMLKFTGTYPYTVTATDATAGTIQITIPLEDMQQIGESAYALFWYTVTPADGSAVETSATFRTVVDVVPPHG